MCIRDSDRTIEVTLRDDVKFHDGRPLTVEDVKFTFDFAKEVKAPYYMSKIKAIESVEITGDNKLVFKLSEPFAPFMSNGLALVGILPKHIWESKYQELGAEGILSWPNTPVSYTHLDVYKRQPLRVLKKVVNRVYLK